MHPIIKISLLLFLVVFLFTGCVSKSLTVEKREEGTVYSTPKIRLLGFGDTAGQDQDVSVLSEVICASEKQCEGDEYIVTLIHFGNFPVFEGKEASFLADGQPVLTNGEPEYFNEYTEEWYEQYTVYFTKKDFKVLANAGSVVIEVSELKLKLSPENREWWKMLINPFNPPSK